MNRSDLTLVGIATVASLLILIPLGVGLADAQTDFGTTSNETSAEFESVTEPPTEPEPPTEQTNVSPPMEPPSEPAPNPLLEELMANTVLPEDAVIVEPFDEEFEYTLDGNPIQLNTGNNIILINSDCSVQINEYNQRPVFTNSNHVVRVAEYESDNWTDMEINNASCRVLSYDNNDSLEYGEGMKTVQENFEGVLTKYYDVSNPEKTKVSVEFENNFYPNHKFMTYEQITLAEQNITFNGQEIDLADYVGESFDRSVLDNYTDVLIGFNGDTAWYQSEVGFENLWSVDMIDANQINLNYGKTDDVTPIGEKYVLDPLIWGTQSSIQSSVLRFDTGSWSYPTVGTIGSTSTKFDVTYPSHSGWASSYVYLSGAQFNAEVTGDFTWVLYNHQGTNYGGTGVTFKMTDGSQVACGSGSSNSGLSYASKGCSSTSQGNSSYSGTSGLNGDITITRTGNTYTMSYAGITKSQSGTLGYVELVDSRWTYAFSNSIYMQTKSFNDPNYVPPSVPDAPTSLVATNHGDKIHVTWRDGASNGNMPIDYYEVYGMAGSKLATVQVSEGQSFWHTGSNTVVPYVAGNTEQYYVLSHNSIGLSSASSSSNNIIGSTPPLAPTGLTATLNGGNADLSWTMPSGHGYAVTGYRIEFADSSDLSSIPNNWDLSNAGGGGDEVGYTTGVGTWTKDSGSSQWGDSKVASFEKFTAPNKDYVLSYQAVTLDNEAQGIDWANWQSGSASPTEPIVGVTEGIIGKAGDFTSTTAILDTGDSAPNNLNAGSISMWFYPTTTGQSNGNPFSSNGYGCYAYQQGQWGYANESMYCGSLQTGADVFNLNEWNHLVITKSQTTGNGQMYLNGVLEVDVSENKTPNHLVDGLYFGGQYHSNPQLKYPFTGYIDEVSTWKMKLTSTHVNQLYNNGLANTPDAVTGYQDALMMYLNFDDDQVPVANMAQTDIYHDAFSFDFSPSSSSSTGFFGLGQGKLQHNDLNTSSKMSDSMKFGYFIAGESKVYEDDDRTTAKNVQASFNADDVYRISVDEGGKVQYWRQASGTGNFNLEYTSPHKAVGAYYIQGNHNTNGQGFEDIVVNEIDWTVKDSWTGNSNTSFTHTNLPVNETYYWKVQAGSAYPTMGHWSNNPTIYSIQPTGVASSGVTSNTSTNCPTGTDSYVWYLRNYNSNPSNNGCRSPYADMSISAIPDNAKITDVTAQYQNDWINGVGGVTEWNSMGKCI